jgi:hypothetical protein
MRHYAPNRKLFDSIPDNIIRILDLFNTSSHTTALGSTQPLTEMIAKNLSGVKVRPARMAYNLTAICQPIV